MFNMFVQCNILIFKDLISRRVTYTGLCVTFTGPHDTNTGSKCDIYGKIDVTFTGVCDIYRKKILENILQEDNFITLSQLFINLDKH